MDPLTALRVGRGVCASPPPPPLSFCVQSPVPPPLPSKLGLPVCVWWRRVRMHVQACVATTTSIAVSGGARGAGAQGGLGEGGEIQGLGFRVRGEGGGPVRFPWRRGSAALTAGSCVPLKLPGAGVSPSQGLPRFTCSCKDA